MTKSDLHFSSSEIFEKLQLLIDEPNKNLVPEKSVFFSRTSCSLQCVSPARTLSISTTGALCKQNCAHCNGHYLKGMQNLSQVDWQRLSSYSSILISGGGDSRGAVSIFEHIPRILDIPEDKILNVHPGFQPVENLIPLKQRKTVISFDLPGCEEVIKEIYRLPYSPEDYQKLFKDYRYQFKTVPHVTIGLNNGKDSGEFDTIDFLAEENVEETVFIVFRPTPGTEMSDCCPPEISHVIRILKYAMNKLQGKITLGCMRPAGNYRRQLDALAWLNGVEKIVHPDHSLTGILRAGSVKIDEIKNCCAI